MEVKLVIGVLFCVITTVTGQGFFNGIFGSDLILDDRFINLFNNPSNFTEYYLPCTVADTTINNGGQVLEGSCMHSTDCKFSGGTSNARGNCSLLQTCCTFQKTCGNTVRSRVSYFQVNNIVRLADRDTTCSLNVRRINSRISQIRVDIINLNIAPPVLASTTPPAEPVLETYTFRCNNDIFTVRETTEVEIPEICGNNANNHFYIHLTPGQREINLDVLLGGIDRVIAAPANWNLKITQLESPSIRTKFDPERQKKENPNQLARDYTTLAPDGCLQYFTETSGTVRSFGYVTNADTTLTTGQNYAACFKNNGNCGIEFNFIYAYLRNTDMDNCFEMLIIPEPVPEYTVCNVAPQSGLVINSIHPGPLYFHFMNGRPVSDNTVAGGFEIRYTRATC